MLPSADKLYGDADFIFQQDLALVLLSSTKIMTKYRRQRTFITWRKRDETQRKCWSCDDEMFNYNRLSLNILYFVCLNNISEHDLF